MKGYFFAIDPEERLLGGENPGPLAKQEDSLSVGRFRLKSAEYGSAVDPVKPSRSRSP